MPQDKKKIFIFCNGCHRRLLDTSRITDYFKKNNFGITHYAQEADYIIFVSCAFSYKEKQSFDLIEKFSKCKGELIVLGCLPDMSPRFKEIFKGRYIETRNLENIDTVFNTFKVKFSIISDSLPLNDYPLCFNKKPNIFLRFFSHFALNKEFLRKCLRSIRGSFKKIQGIKNEEKEVYLRISNGCSERCAYCGKWKAIGELRSKSIKECVAEYKKLLQEKHCFIVFIADDLGAYGLDIGTDFESLINKILSVDDDAQVRWRFEEMHPRWVIKYKDILLKLIRERKLTEMISAIQSGNNRILKLMNRHHTMEEITEVLTSFIKVNPGLKIWTQVIVGFPSETEEEFFESILALKKVRFYSVLLFRYHDALGALTSTMPNKLSENVITERINRAKILLEKEGINVNIY